MKNKTKTQNFFFLIRFFLFWDLLKAELFIEYPVSILVSVSQVQENSWLAS